MITHGKPETFVPYQILNRSLLSNANQLESIIHVAAINAATTLMNVEQQQLSDFSTIPKKPFFVYSDISIPDTAPLWCKDRSLLWNRLVQSQPRPNVPIAAEFVLALPLELENETYIAITKSIVIHEFIAKSLIVDASTHLSKPWDPHAHFLVPLFVPTTENFSDRPVVLDVNATKKKLLTYRI